MNVSCSYGKCHPCNMYNPLTEFYQAMFCRWERTRAFLSPSEDAMCDSVQSFPLLALRIYHFTFFWHNFPFIKQMSYFTIDNWKVTNKFPMWTQNFLVLWRMVLRKCENLGTGQPASTDLRHRRPLMKCYIIICRDHCGSYSSSPVQCMLRHMLTHTSGMCQLHAVPC